MHTGGHFTIGGGPGGVSSFTFPCVFPLANPSPMKGLGTREVLIGAGDMG